MRPNNFDLIRLLAALQVVYCHTCFHLKLTTGIADPFLARLVHWFPGVPIFFTISGFLISRSWERSPNLSDYAFKRVLRIYPALWVQLACGILVAAAFGAITPAVVSNPTFFVWLLAQSSCVQFFNPSFLRGFGLGVLNGSLWTIPVELGFYVTLPILYVVVVNRLKQLWADVVLGSLALLSFGYWYHLSMYADPESIWTKLQMVTPVPHLYMFLLGIMLQRNFERLKPILENQVMKWSVAFAACMIVLEPWGPETLSAVPYKVLVGRILLAMTVLSLAFSWRSLSERLLRGHDLSYGVYLYHGLAINVLVELNWIGNPWELLLVTSLTISLATLSWIFIERPAVLMKTSGKPRLTPDPNPAHSAVAIDSIVLPRRAA